MSTEPRIVDGLKVIEHEPGADLPPVPVAALRPGEDLERLRVHAEVQPATPEFLALADPNTPLPPAGAPTSPPETPATPPQADPRAGS